MFCSEKITAVGLFSHRILLEADLIRKRDNVVKQAESTTDAEHIEILKDKALIYTIRISNINDILCRKDPLHTSILLKI